MDPIQSASKNEPDIAIFDSPFAFTDESEQPFRNITIIEFKRPGRESYGDSENPIQQVIEYMDDFTNGKIKTKDGLTIDGNIFRYCQHWNCKHDERVKKQESIWDNFRFDGVRLRLTKKNLIRIRIRFFFLSRPHVEHTQTLRV